MSFPWSGPWKTIRSKEETSTVCTELGRACCLWRRPFLVRIDCAFGFFVLRGLRPAKLAKLASVHSGSHSVFSAPS
jgi:hypothetical protein